MAPEPRKKKTRIELLRDPLAPPPINKRITFAWQAITEGTATDSQQKAFAYWLVNDLCRANDMPYRPDEPGKSGARDTDFACGRMMPGQHLKTLMLIDAKKLPNPEEEEQYV